MRPPLNDCWSPESAAANRLRLGAASPAEKESWRGTLLLAASALAGFAITGAVVAGLTLLRFSALG